MHNKQLGTISNFATARTLQRRNILFQEIFTCRNFAPVGTSKCRNSEPEGTLQL
jgi:hypothetical protein